MSFGWYPSEVAASARVHELYLDYSNGIMRAWPNKPLKLRVVDNRPLHAQLVSGSRTNPVVSGSRTNPAQSARPVKRDESNPLELAMRDYHRAQETYNQGEQGKDVLAKVNKIRRGEGSPLDLSERKPGDVLKEAKDRVEQSILNTLDAKKTLKDGVAGLTERKMNQVTHLANQLGKSDPWLTTHTGEPYRLSTPVQSSFQLPGGVDTRSRSGSSPDSNAWTAKPATALPGATPSANWYSSYGAAPEPAWSHATDRNGSDIIVGPGPTEVPEGASPTPDEPRRGWDSVQECGFGSKSPRESGANDELLSRARWWLG